MKKIREILLIVLLILVIVLIFRLVGINAELKVVEENYTNAKEKNEKTQAKSNTKIKTYRFEIKQLNQKIRLLESEARVAEVVIKWKTRWKTKYKIKTVDKIEYVTVPVQDFSLCLEKVELLEQLVSKWKLSALEWEKKYMSEKVLNDNANVYIKELKKTNNKKKWTSAGIGIVLGVLLTIILGG